MKSGTMISIVLAVGCTLSSMGASAAEKESQDAYAQSKHIISKYKALFAAPPKSIPASTSTDAPLLGNGSIGVAIGGKPEEQTFYFCKNDFWCYRARGFFSGIGRAVIRIPKLKGASYRVEQDLYRAETRAVFSVGDKTVTMLSYVPANNNLLIVELEARGATWSGEIALAPSTGTTGKEAESDSGTRDEVVWITKQFKEKVDIPSAVAVAATLHGAHGTQFTLVPGKTVRLVVGLRSLFDSPDYLPETIKQVKDVPFESIQSNHRAWWREFWSKSYVEIGDPILEQRYYLSQYVLGSCMRDLEFPPSLFGPWLTSHYPRWQGDYHLNYNYQAPFYGLYSSNRIEQANTYHAPILAYMNTAGKHAKSIDCRGVYCPVGIGPKGITTSKGFYGQKSNTAYCLVNMASHWYGTYDPEYGKRVYPFVRAVADFWEDYLTWDDKAKRYTIENDAVHENSGKDRNSILSLGLVRNAFTLVLDMSNTMKLDVKRHEKWNHILKHLSTYTTQKMQGRTVFRYTEKGMAWHGRNTLGIQHIYPAGAIGLEDSQELLKLCHDTLEVMSRWKDNNGMNSFYPAAVRMGYKPKVILAKLKEMLAAIGAANGFISRNPHGIENCSLVPNTINEMLCMSHQHVLRLFPVWPKEQDARFENIRAWGAFLVSSVLKDGQVQFVRIKSERGRKCTIVNPWPGRAVIVVRNDRKAETVSGNRFTLTTAVNEQLRLQPQPQP